VVGLAIAAAGCGGGDDSTTETETSVALSRGPSGPDEIGRFITDEFAPATEDGLDDIRALTPPEGDERQVDAILDAAEAAVAAVGERPSLFVTGSPFAEANTLTAEYGLRVCGR
jgi:hypothetical protein